MYSELRFRLGEEVWWVAGKQTIRSGEVRRRFYSFEEGPSGVRELTRYAVSNNGVEYKIEEDQLYPTLHALELVISPDEDRTASQRAQAQGLRCPKCGTFCESEQD